MAGDREAFTVCEFMGLDHTKKRVRAVPKDDSEVHWLVRWQWRIDPENWETMHEVEATERPEVYE